MTRHRRGHHRIRWRSIFLWHRYLGLASALFVALLAVTGLMLNHTGGLNLDKRYVHAGWMLDWYGITAPERIVGFDAAGHRVTQVGSRLYLDRTEIARNTGRLVGAAALEGLIVVGTPGALLLLTPEGELIERLGGAQGTPAGMESLGRTDSLLAVRAAHGVYTTDTDFLEWGRHAGGEEVRWAEPSPTPPALRSELITRYRGSGLTQERVVLDLHSGRILGAAGVYLIDAAAVAFVLLAVLGIWVWASRKR